MEDEKPRRSKKEQNRKRGSSNPIAVAHSRRGGAGSGFHTDRHERRHQKHKRPWYDEYQDLDDWEEDSEE